MLSHESCGDGIFITQFIVVGFFSLFVLIWVWYCFLCAVFSSFCLSSLLCVGGYAFHYCSHSFHLSSLTSPVHLSTLLNVASGISIVLVL